MRVASAIPTLFPYKLLKIGMITSKDDYKRIQTFGDDYLLKPPCITQMELVEEKQLAIVVYIL